MKKKLIWTTLLTMIALIVMCTTSVFAASKATPSKVTLNKISAPAYNKISISWKKAANATHYRIYYRTPSTSWKRIATVPASQTSYTHTSSKSCPIVVGQKYAYTVKGYNSSSKKLGTCNMKGLIKNTVPSEPKLKTPVLNDNGTVTLNWAKANGCDYYYVFRRTSTSGKWMRIAILKSNMLTYTDDSPYDGKTNYYTVRGYYSKTKVYGGYTNGKFVFVPEIETEPEPTPTPEPEDPTPTPTPVPEEPDEPEEPEINVYQWAQEVFELTNQERIKNGCQPFQYNQRLQDYGMIRAKEISTNFSHYRPDGTVGDYHENIAGGYSPEGVVRSWMNSSGHRAAIMNPNFTHIGVGVYVTETGRILFVQAFADFDPDRNVTITFNPNGGTCSQTTMLVPYKSTIYQKNLPIPTREGYTFKGWSSYGDLFKNYVVANTDLTFIAEWE